MAQSLPANDKIPDLIAAIKGEFAGIFDDLRLSIWENQFILRKKGKFVLMEDVRIKEVAGWLNLRGYDVKIMPADCMLAGEILLNAA